MMTPEDRYLRDPLFRRLVDALHQQLAEYRMTGTEIREAAVMAAQMHEERKMHRGIFVPREQFPEHLRELQRNLDIEMTGLGPMPKPLKDRIHDNSND